MAYHSAIFQSPIMAWPTGQLTLVVTSQWSSFWHFVCSTPSSIFTIFIRAACEQFHIHLFAWSNRPDSVKNRWQTHAHSWVCSRSKVCQCRPYFMSEVAKWSPFALFNSCIWWRQYKFKRNNVEDGLYFKVNFKSSIFCGNLFPAAYRLLITSIVLFYFFTIINVFILLLHNDNVFAKPKTWLIFCLKYMSMIRSEAANEMWSRDTWQRNTIQPLTCIDGAICLWALI